METTLLRGGKLIDGTGGAPFSGDLLMSESRISEVGCFDPPADCRVIECSGLTIAPGFIDAHSHSDLQVLSGFREKANQGVTTEVVGNCGFSAYPCGTDRHRLQEYANGVFMGGDEWGWPNASEYLEQVCRRSGLANVLSLVGHGSLRVALFGHRQGPLESSELDRLEQTLDESLDGGACGFSTGLMYAPGSSAPFEELLRLCRVVERRGKIYATHMRSYSWRLVESVNEQIELARRSGCRLQISHLQAVGRANWDKQQRAIESIDQARNEGIDVGFDIYPYLAGSTVLLQLLPQWALDGGIPSLLQLLASPSRRREIAAEIKAELAQEWTDILITSTRSARNHTLVGETVAAIAIARGKDPIETVMDLLEEEEGEINIISFNQSADNLRQLLAHPLCLVISDGFYVRGRPHPRLCGTFPKLLGHVCREKRWLSLPEAVHKVTGKPAERFRLCQRGLLRPGYFADVTVFDAARVAGPASYEDPYKPPEGIRLAFRNGQQITPSLA